MLESTENKLNIICCKFQKRSKILVNIDISLEIKLENRKENAMTKFKTCSKFGIMGNSPNIMGKYVVKNHKNSRNLHKNDKY